MTTEQMIQLVNQVERNAGAILVRESIDGQVGNFSLLDLPTHLAIQHTCRIFRTALRQDLQPSSKLPS